LGDSKKQSDTNLMVGSRNISLSIASLKVGFQTTSASNFTLFENLNLELPAGQLVCFMGPNGVGKSSLIRTISRLQKPLAGTVRVFDEVLDNPSKAISVVLTDRISNTNLTGYELISLGRYPYLGWNLSLNESDRSIVDNAIKRVNVQHLIHQKISELSDGQLQMIMIARALAQDTPIILLDEPTAHLDLNNRVEVMKLLREITRTTKKSILVSTHELDLALQTADYIWLAGNKKNIMTGIPEDLVLDGSFDAIFQFKGFDLKTGRIQHHANRDIQLELRGDGYEYLWTKNALERTGYTVNSSNGQHVITVNRKSSTLEWVFGDQESDVSFSSISALLDYLNQTIAYRNK
jgi:iron complex transport system ATP-binding protein